MTAPAPVVPLYVAYRHRRGQVWYDASPYGQAPYAPTAPYPEDNPYRTYPQ